MRAFQATAVSFRTAGGVCLAIVVLQFVTMRKLLVMLNAMMRDQVPWQRHPASTGIASCQATQLLFGATAIVKGVPYGVAVPCQTIVSATPSCSRRAPLFQLHRFPNLQV